jgi:beta-lactamase class A
MKKMSLCGIYKIETILEGYMNKKIGTMFVACSLFVNSAYAASVSQENIQTSIRNFDGSVGIYAKNLRTGKVFDYNEHTVFPSASTSKLVVALATYKYLYPTAELEDKGTYDEDVKYMMTISDNPSFYELLEEIKEKKPDALTRVVKDLRLKATQIHSKSAFNKYNYHSVTTPYEMSKVCEAIYAGKYLGKEKSSYIKYNLTNSIFQEEIPRYMDTPVMHKVGQLDDILCDVGVVDDGKDQILISVFTKTDQSEEYASDFIAGISAKLYNELRRK